MFNEKFSKESVSFIIKRAMIKESFSSWSSRQIVKLPMSLCFHSKSTMFNDKVPKESVSFIIKRAMIKESFSSWSSRQIVKLPMSLCFHSKLTVDANSYSSHLCFTTLFNSKVACWLVWFCSIQKTILKKKYNRSTRIKGPFPLVKIFFPMAYAVLN